MAMLGLLLAIAAPAFIVTTPRGGTDLHAVLSATRRTAVLRAEPVTLSIDDAGAWSLTRDAAPAAAPIANGTLDEPAGRVRVRVSPLGACVPELSSPPHRDWSALGCGPSVVAIEVPRS